MERVQRYAFPLAEVQAPFEFMTSFRYTVKENGRLLSEISQKRGEVRANILNC